MTLELLCCCCGGLMASLPVPWDSAITQPQPWWTRNPCAPCEAQLAANDAQLTAERRSRP